MAVTSSSRVAVAAGVSGCTSHSFCNPHHVSSTVSPSSVSISFRSVGDNVRTHGPFTSSSIQTRKSNALLPWDVSGNFSFSRKSRATALRGGSKYWSSSSFTYTIIGSPNTPSGDTRSASPRWYWGLYCLRFHTQAVHHRTSRAIVCYGSRCYRQSHWKYRSYCALYRTLQQLMNRLDFSTCSGTLTSSTCLP